MPESEQFGFEGGAMANGVANGDEKREEDGSHAVECGATINRRKRLDDPVTDGVFGRDRIADALRGVRGYVRLVSRGRRRITVVRDPKDNPILECARAARAKYLVTGDRDLLILRSYGRLRILTIRDFLIRYPSTSET
jgi:hypothetical protein